MSTVEKKHDLSEESVKAILYLETLNFNDMRSINFEIIPGVRIAFWNKMTRKLIDMLENGDKTQQYIAMAFTIAIRQKIESAKRAKKER